MIRFKKVSLKLFKNFKMTSEKEILTSLRNIIKWPLYLCQVGGFITLHLNKRNEYKFSICISFFSFLHIINQIACFIIAFFYLTEFSETFNQVTTTERYVNLAINMGYFIGQIVLRFVVLLNRKRIQALQKSFNKRLFELCNENSEASKTSMLKIEKNMKILSGIGGSLTIVNGFLIWLTYGVPAFIKHMDDNDYIEIHGRIVLICLMVSDFTCVIVLYSSIVMCKTIIASLRLIRLKKCSSNLHELKQFKAIRKLIHEVNTGSFSLIILIWLISTVAILLHQNFAILVYIRTGNYLMLLGLFPTYSLSTIGIFILCNSGEKLTQEVKKRVISIMKINISDKLYETFRRS